MSQDLPEKPARKPIGTGGVIVTVGVVAFATMAVVHGIGNFRDHGSFSVDKRMMVVQERLNKIADPDLHVLPGDKVDVNGRIHDPATTARIIAFQKAYGISPADGVVGPDTWAALNKAAYAADAAKVANARAKAAAEKAQADAAADAEARRRDAEARQKAAKAAQCSNNRAAIITAFKGEIARIDCGNDNADVYVDEDGFMTLSKYERHQLAGTLEQALGVWAVHLIGAHTGEWLDLNGGSR
jgi:hypothetical protein